MDSIYGMPVIENPMLQKEQPVLQLSSDFKWCTDEFREKENQWLKEMFGTKPSFLMIANPTTGRESIITHPANIELLKRNIDILRR